MKRIQLVLEGALGGVILGTLLGLAESLWLWRTGVDGSLLPWGWGLYGLAGLLPGLLIGTLVTVLHRWGPRVRAMAFPGGAALSLFVLGTVLGRYVLNRDVFAESMPLWATGALAGGLLVVGVGLVAAVPLRLGRTGALATAGGWLAGFLVCLVVGVLTAPGVDREAWRAPTAGEASLDGPDILFILVDTMRADHLDHDELVTPNLDALRADAITFDQAFSAASWTRPGVASAWTSRLPTSHTADTKGSRLPEAVVTWAEPLQARGVRTGALVNNINVTASFGFDQGFDTFHYEAPAYPFGATEGVFGLALYKVVHRVEERLTGGGPVERYYQPADVVLDDAHTWIEGQEGARWALFVHLMEPHDPYFDASGHGYARAAHLTPDPSEEAELRARYGLEVERLDAALGAFLERLRADGRYDDTLIVLTSDHGEEFNEHGGWWHGTSLYGEQTQVPLVVKLPGNVGGGTRAPWQVRTLDLPPTLTAALDLPPDPSWQGTDLFDDDSRARLGLLDAPAAEDEAPAPQLDPATACRQARRDARDRLVVMELDFEGNEAAAVRADGFAYHTAAPGGSRELPGSALYDVVADPNESEDLLASGTSVCSRFPEDWQSDLELALEVARRAGDDVERVGVEASEADKQRLCALGYLTGPECE